MSENKDIRKELSEEAEKGEVSISNEVIASIAGIAAAEVEGVSGMAGSVAEGIVEKLGAKKNPQKGVRVSVTEEGATIDVLVVVAFGMRIPDVSWEIQESVKGSVESMTGINVVAVNVFIEGVSFEKKKKKTPKASDIIDADETENE